MKLTTTHTKQQRFPHEPETQTTSEFPTTHPFIPINTITTEEASTPTDPQLKTLVIPIISQLQPQPQTIESTSNEISLDSLNQDQLGTETHGSHPHSIPAIIEPSSESPSQATSIDLTPSPQEHTISTTPKKKRIRSSKKNHPEKNERSKH
jgi:hypothetical protein